MTTAARQRNPDGSIAFTCTGCGSDVFMAVDDGFDFPVCIECRWFGERPWIKRPKPTKSDGADAFLQGNPVLYTDGEGRLSIATYLRDEQDRIGTGLLQIKDAAGKLTFHAVMGEAQARAFYRWNMEGAR